MHNHHTHVHLLQECTVPEGLVALPQNCSSVIGKPLFDALLKLPAIQMVPAGAWLCLP